MPRTNAMVRQSQARIPVSGCSLPFGIRLDLLFSKDAITSSMHSLIPPRDHGIVAVSLLAVLAGHLNRVESYF